MKEKIIICSGDSYTAGIETAADKYIPGYTKSIISINSIENPYRKKYEKLSRIFRKISVQEYQEYENECKKNAWPVYLQKMSNKQVLNISSGGISNHEIVHRTVKTYLKLLNEGAKPNDIVVLCMLSSPARIGYPQYDKNYGGEYNYQSFINGFRPGAQGGADCAVRYWYTSHNDWDMLWSTYSVVQGLKSFIEHHNSRIYFFDSGLIEIFRMSINMDEVGLQNYKNIIQSMNLSLRMTDLLAREFPMCKLPGAHPTTEGHRVFAEKVWNSIL